MKKRKVCCLLGIFLFSFFLSACATPLIPEELQLPEIYHETAQWLKQQEEREQKIQKAIGSIEKKLTASDLSDLPIARETMTKEELRQLCLNFFRLQLSFQWTPNTDWNDWRVTYTTRRKTLDLGTVYAGIPYQSTGTGNLYRWMEYYDSNTGMVDLLRAIEENGGTEKTDFQYKNGNLFYYKYRWMKSMFNQCSVGSFWGWGRVINSANFNSTQDMNVYNGFIPVGGYTYGYEYEGKYYGADVIRDFGVTTAYNPLGYDTVQVISDWNAKNGSDAMYRCYAEMKPADCLVSPGHAMMVKEVFPVYRQDGTLDPKKSTAVILEQTEDWSRQTTLPSGLPYKVQGGIDLVFSFAKLQASSYIPFTFAEFLEEDDPRILGYSSSVLSCYRVFTDLAKNKTGIGVEEANVYCTVSSSKSSITLTELAAMTVGSNYPISDVFVTVRDQNQNTVLTNVHRAQTAQLREVSMTAQKSTWEEGATLCDGLRAYTGGAYRVEISLQLSNGQKMIAYGGILL